MIGQESLSMNRFAGPAIAVAVVVFAIAIATYALGLGLLPSYAEASEKQIVAPYVIVWTMLWIMEACAISLGVSLLKHGSRGLFSRAG
jgi:hypothetical protein